MIADAEIYRKANTIADQYAEIIKAGKATPAERERWQHIVDHILVYEWARDGRRGEPDAVLLPALPAPEPHPLATRFVEWYGRNRTAPKWTGETWEYAFVWWWQPFALEQGVPAFLEAMDDVETLLYTQGPRRLEPITGEAA